MTKFVVDLGDIKMSKATQAHISTSIQKSVLANLADLQIDGPSVIGFPIEWRGLIIRRDLDQFKIGEQQVAKQFNL